MQTVRVKEIKTHSTRKKVTEEEQIRRKNEDIREKKREIIKEVGEEVEGREQQQGQEQGPGEGVKKKEG
jgi:hypothetical protein